MLSSGEFSKWWCVRICVSLIRQSSWYLLRSCCNAFPHFANALVVCILPMIKEQKLCRANADLLLPVILFFFYDIFNDVVI
jgi:hypothetical protein